MSSFFEEESKNQNGPYRQTIQYESRQDNKQYKFVVVGPSGSGKSSFIQKVLGEAYDSEISTTSSYETHVKYFSIDEQEIELKIWDCGTNHELSYPTVQKAFFKGAQLVIIVVDLEEDIEMFKDADKWIKESLDNEILQIVVIGNKLDLMLIKPSEAKIAADNRYRRIQLCDQNKMIDHDQMVGELKKRFDRTSSIKQIDQKQLIDLCILQMRNQIANSSVIDFYVGSCEIEFVAHQSLEKMFIDLVLKYCKNAESNIFKKPIEKSKVLEVPVELSASVKRRTPKNCNLI